MSKQHYIRKIGDYEIKLSVERPRLGCSVKHVDGFLWQRECPHHVQAELHLINTTITEYLSFKEPHYFGASNTIIRNGAYGERFHPAKGFDTVEELLLQRGYSAGTLPSGITIPKPRHVEELNKFLRANYGKPLDSKLHGSIMVIVDRSAPLPTNA